MLPCPRPNFEIQKYYQKEPKFNGVYSRNNLPKIKYGAYVRNLDECKSMQIHLIALYDNNNNNNTNNDKNNVTYCESFGFEHIPKEIKKFIGNKNIIINIYRIQTYNSKMYGYFCIGFNDFMLTGKSLLDYTYSFSSNDYEKNDKIILKYFQ